VDPAELAEYPLHLVGTRPALRKTGDLQAFSCVFPMGLLQYTQWSDAEVCMEELRRLRKVKGLSQAKLAVMAGLDPSTVSQIETGARRANTRTLERLAAVLGTEVADLFPKGQASLPEMQEYGALLEEKGFPSEQIAAWLAQEERDKEFIARELNEEKSREALIAANPRLRRYYREKQARTDAPPRSKSA
jgi:transcriptional regulator with XRE-family HTH domain